METGVILMAILMALFVASVAYIIGAANWQSWQEKYDADNAISDTPSVEWKKALVHARARQEARRLEEQ